MSYIVITGASSGIGKALTDYFLDHNKKVIAISRSIKDKEGLIALTCDLNNPKEIKQKLLELDKQYDISGLINCAGIGIFEPHEEISSTMIERLTQINLTAPMQLCAAYLRSIKKNSGFIINVTSIEATRSSKFSALYTATKAGLRAFSLALFEEVRKSGVQVMTLNPDMTDTPFFDTLKFKPNENAVLDPQSIIATVDMALKLPQNATITELTIRPQFFKIDKNL